MVTKAETFIWYQATPRLQLGLAHLFEQNAFRYLATWQALPETEEAPSLNLMAGVQGIGTGNPGYAASFEKNFRTPQGDWVAFVGIGFRANENHGHGLYGLRFALPNGLALGMQHDGHDSHVFTTYSRGRHFGGVYLVGLESPALMIGTRF